MKKIKYTTLTISITLILLGLLTLTSCGNSPDIKKGGTGDPNVYFTRDISPAGLMAVYKALGATPTGKVAVKLSTGEPGNTHYLDPNLIKELVQSVNGTIVESNVAYPGPRHSADTHYQVAVDHGFTAIAPVVIMDAEGEMELPVPDGKHLKENIVGKAFADFDYHVVLSHFKGHGSGGFGGALKNLSIGYASSAGKANIHTHGKSREISFRDNDQDSFLESMAEAAKTITDSAAGKILFVNVMNHLSVDCDCNGNPAAPTMSDIGILASLDPVALDQACVDLVYASPESADMKERIESRHGIRTIERATEIGMGSRKYNLVEIK